MLASYVGHQRENKIKKRPYFTKIAVLCDVLTCIVKFCFSKPWVAVEVTLCCFNVKVELQVFLQYVKSSLKSLNDVQVTSQVLKHKM